MNSSKVMASVHVRQLLGESGDSGHLAFFCPFFERSIFCKWHYMRFSAHENTSSAVELILGSRVRLPILHWTRSIRLGYSYGLRGHAHPIVPCTTPTLDYDAMSVAAVGTEVCVLHASKFLSSQIDLRRHTHSLSSP